MPRKIEISHRTIVFTALFLASIWFLYLIRQTILQLFVALLIMAILNPLATKLAKFRIPRGLSVFIVYVIAIGIFSFAIAGIIPPVVQESRDFATSLPEYVNNLDLPSPVAQDLAAQLTNQLAVIPGQALRVSVSVFSNFLTVVTVSIIAFYLLVSRDKMDEQLFSILGEQRARKIASIMGKLELRLGSWTRGQLLLMILIGTATYVGLLILGIPFALALAILAALLEIVPILGPILASVPAIIVGLGVSPLTGLGVGALALLIQQLENFVFVPNVMQKSVGLNPVITLVALMIGFELAGVVGAIISIPVVISLQTIIEGYLE